MHTCACCVNSVHAQRLHEHLEVMWLKHTYTVRCVCMSVLWPPVCEIANAFSGKLSWEMVVGAVYIIFVVDSYVVIKAHCECVGISHDLRARWHKAGMCVMVGCELFWQAVPVWPSWTQPCWLGSAVQQAVCVHQHSCVSCFCGPCDLHIHEHCGGHIQSVLDSHSPLQQ